MRNIMKDKTQTIILVGVWLFFLCYFLQAFDLPNVLTVALGGIFGLLMVMQQKKVRVDLGICLLTITLASYYLIINGVEGLSYMILYLPLIIYVVAHYAVCSVQKDEQYDSKIMWLLMSLIIGFTIYGILNSYMYYAGYVVPGTRRWQDFWSHEIVPGTQHTAYFLPMMAMFFPAIVYFGKRIWKSVVVVLLTVFFCYTSLATRSRMPLLIFAIAMMVQAVLYAFLEWEKVKCILCDKKTWIAGVVLLVSMLVGFVFVKDTPVMSAFINNLGKDGGILNNVRFVAQRQALSQLFDYPMGGRQMEMSLGNYCHNTWLDMANAAGLIPFFAFTAYTLFGAYELVRLVKTQTVTTELKLVAVGLFAVFFLYYSVEPALDASIHYLTPWIFLNGMLYGVNTKNRNL